METMRWEEGSLFLLDQTKLPAKVEYLRCSDYQTVAEAIRRLKVRGAPAIGVAAAYALALGVSKQRFSSREQFRQRVNEIVHELNLTRPTAVNLNWALKRMLKRLEQASGENLGELKDVLLQEAQAIYNEDLETNRSIGRSGEALIPYGARILTHCNAGALATAGYGTALGVIRAAAAAGKAISVIACETRPLLQGARLTVWEMLAENIPVTLITDNMAASLMAGGGADLVIVGADRVAANGDTANKIGTYSLAVLAREHAIPFYIAAPLSTVDLTIREGRDIPIEERDSAEVTHLAGQPITAAGVQVWNPAFDVTPARLITAIITERGVAHHPYERFLAG